MTDWEPATEAEAALRDALRAADQELYFRILSHVELLLPMSTGAAPGRAAMGWGTWTSGGRTHVLAFTSPQAMNTCLAEYGGGARRMAYADLAGAWPNPEWWLAINPGLPIEGYLPAWFVSQLSRGDVRLPGRTIGARARVEAAAAAQAGGTPVPMSALAASAAARAAYARAVQPQPGAHHAPEPGPARAAPTGRARVPAHAAPEPEPEHEPRRLTAIPPRPVIPSRGTAPPRAPTPPPAPVRPAEPPPPWNPSSPLPVRTPAEPAASFNPLGPPQQATSPVPPPVIPPAAPGRPMVIEGAVVETSAPPAGATQPLPTRFRHPDPPPAPRTEPAQGAAPGRFGAADPIPPYRSGPMAAGPVAAGPVAAGRAEPVRHARPEPDDLDMRHDVVLPSPDPDRTQVVSAPGASGRAEPRSRTESRSRTGSRSRAESITRAESLVRADPPTRAGSVSRAEPVSSADPVTRAEPLTRGQPPTRGESGTRAGPLGVEPVSGAGSGSRPESVSRPGSGTRGAPAGRDAQPVDRAEPATRRPPAASPPGGRLPGYAEPAPGRAAEPAPGRAAESAPGRAAESAPGRAAEPAPSRAAELFPGRAAEPAAGRAAELTTELTTAASRTPPAPAERPAAERPPAAGPPAERPPAERAPAERPPTERPSAERPRGESGRPGAEARPAPDAVPDNPDFTPANVVERELLAAAGDGQTDHFLSTLLLAKVLIPIPPKASPTARPGELGFAWRREQVEGQPYVVVFTSPERMGEYFEGSTDIVEVKFVQLISAWPDESWSFAVNPGTPVGATLPGVQIKALAAWAAEVGLTDQPAVEEAAPGPVTGGTPEPVEQKPVMMQKVISPAQVKYYLERGYDRVSGFVQRSTEVAHLTTPEQLYQALGLGYPDSPFTPDDEEVYLLRWIAFRPDLYRIPFGGRDETSMRAMQGWVIERGPFRGNGFAPGETNDVIAEFKVDSARLPHGAQMWRMRRGSTETLVALLDADGPRWRPIGPDNEVAEPD